MNNDTHTMWRIRRAPMATAVAIITFVGGMYGSAETAGAESRTVAPSAEATSIFDDCPDSDPATTCPPIEVHASASARSISAKVTVDKRPTSTNSDGIQRAAVGTISAVDHLPGPVSSATYRIKVRIGSASMLAYAPVGSATAAAELYAAAGDPCGSWYQCSREATRSVSTVPGSEVELVLKVDKPGELIDGDVPLAVSLRVLAATSPYVDWYTNGPCWPSLSYPGYCEPSTIGVEWAGLAEYEAYASADARVSLESITAEYEMTPLAPRFLTMDQATGEVTLGWLASPSPSPLHGYRIYRNGELIADESIVGGAATSFVDVDAPRDQFVTYAVRAVNDAGEGRAATWTFWVQSQSTPDAPGGLTALSDASTKRADVRVGWDIPADGGAPITSYNLYRSTAGGGFQLLRAVDPAECGAARCDVTDASVSRNTTYSYRVTALNAIGEGAASATASVRPS